MDNEQLKKYGLIGLLKSIDTFNPNLKINFAKHSDKYIKEYTIFGFYLSKINNNWYDKYWKYIYKYISPVGIKIFKLKFTCDFNIINSNKNISNIMNCSVDEINNYLIESYKIINEKIKNEYEINNNMFIKKTKFL